MSLADSGLGPVPAFGLMGAAMATTIGRGLGFYTSAITSSTGSGWFGFIWKHLRPDWHMIRSLVDIAWPAIAILIGSISWIILASLVVSTGQSVASAGYQIAIRLMIFFLLPAWGYEQCRRNTGGSKPGAEARNGRNNRSASPPGTMSFYDTGFLFLILTVPWLVSFLPKTDVAGYTIHALRIMSAGYVFYGIGMVMTNALNGAGDTRTPTVINLFGFWGCRYRWPGYWPCMPAWGRWVFLLPFRWRKRLFLLPPGWFSEGESGN